MEDDYDKHTRKYHDTTKKIKGLMLQNLEIDEIANILKLNREHVRSRVRDLEKRDLRSSNFVDLAEIALKKNLKKGRLGAVKLVYDRVHPKEEIARERSQGSTANVKITLDITRLKGKEVGGVIECDRYDDRPRAVSVED